MEALLPPASASLDAYSLPYYIVYYKESKLDLTKRGQSQKHEPTMTIHAKVKKSSPI